jgi:hypothetical protein
MWKGAEPALLALAMDPELMHTLIDRLVTCYLAALDQFVEFNILARNDTNVRVGSGGYGYTEDLPPKDFHPGRIRTIDMWGNATPQIFASVSPEMHEEFGINYEKKWLDRFGLTYYGCCEPLDGKMEQLAKIKNLRKISVSPWANIKHAAEQMRDTYVVSYKPSSAYLAYCSFDASAIKKRLKEDLFALKECSVEIILKDISTVCYEPARLWQWAQIVQEAINEVHG